MHRRAMDTAPSRTRKTNARRTRSASVVTLVVACLTFAVASSPAWSQTPTEERTTARVKAAGISLQYPSHWTLLAFTPKTVLAQRKAIAKQNPKLMEAVDAEAQVQAAKNSKFAAGDIVAKLEGRIGGGVEVQVVRDFGTSPELVAASVIREYERAGIEVVGTSDIRIGKVPAIRIDVVMRANGPDGTPYEMRLTQVLAPIAGKSIAITLVAADDAAGEAQNDAIVASVRPL